jgi:hypothetical protein
VRLPSQASRETRVPDPTIEHSRDAIVKVAVSSREKRRALRVIPEPFTNGHRDHIIASCGCAKDEPDTNLWRFVSPVRSSQ